VKTSKGAAPTSATKSDGRGRTKTGHLGLVIDPVPGGLYKVRNKAGGTPPHGFLGLYTELRQLQIRIKEYNESRGKEG